MKQSQEGLSLLEMLVVFTIVSMVSVLLVQGFGFGVSLYQRVNESGPGAQKMAMSRNWFREVNSALVVQNDPLMTLLGDAGRIKAYSLNPLFGAPGKPTQIAEAQQAVTNRRASQVHHPLPPLDRDDAPAQHTPTQDAPSTPRGRRAAPRSPPCTDVAASTPPFDSPTHSVTTPALDIAKRNFYAELHQLCFLGAISIGRDNCINPKMPRSELQHDYR